MNATRSRELAVYAVVVVLLVVPANLYAGAAGAEAHDPAASPPLVQAALYGQAVIPAIAAICAWGSAGRWPVGGFRRTSVGVLGTAWLVGLGAAASGYLAAWLAGVAGFSRAALEAGTGMPAPLAVIVAVGPGVLPWIVLAAGEELGWNSFLLPRLRERLDPDRTAVALGLIWAAFHLPLMILVDGAVAPGVPALYAISMFTVECVALTFPLVWLRLRSGSIWPALVLHACLNSVLYLLAEPATTPRTGSAWLVGEGGALVAAGTVITVVLTAPLWRRPAARPAAGSAPTPVPSTQLEAVLP